MPVLLVGLGVLVEVLRDTALALAPTGKLARRMLESLKAFKLRQGLPRCAGCGSDAAWQRSRRVWSSLPTMQTRVEEIDVIRWSRGPTARSALDALIVIRERGSFHEFGFRRVGPFPGWPSPWCSALIGLSAICASIRQACT